jgi:hypothetical protein
MSQLNVNQIVDASGGVLAPISSVMRNRIINGAMVIDQRNAGASVTPASFAYTLDRWQAVQTTASKFSVQQNAAAVTPPAGFTNYLGVTSLSAYSVAAGDTFNILQSVEGFNCSDFAWGTASAKTVTLSFWVRSSLTGTFGGAIKDGSSTNSYPFSYTISTANTWEQKSVTIVGPTAGQFSYTSTTNGIGLQVAFGLGAGATFSGTAGAWAAVNAYSATGATSVVGTNGATFYITGVQLEVGTQATSFEYRQYGTELALCQRYYYQMSGASPYVRFGIGPANQTTSAVITNQFQTFMRAVPTSITYSGTFAVWAGATIFASSALTLDTSSSGQNAGVLSATTTGIAIGTTYQLIGNNDSTTKLAYSAEL